VRLVATGELRRLRRHELGGLFELACQTRISRLPVRISYPGDHVLEIDTIRIDMDAS